MGDIADMMLDGILCQYCGEYIGDDVGYPRSCAGCSGTDDEDFDFEDMEDEEDGED